jgi:NADH dehydrogenase
MSDHVGRRRVAIVGGGFGGLAAAHALRRADVDVTVVDRMNHQLFQPLLYQVAAGGLSVGECATPIRALLRGQPNVRVAMGAAVELDAERRELTLDRGERIGYDSLIVACGGETSYFGREEWRESASGLKTLADAVALRERIFTAFEEAERAPNPGAQVPWLTFVVIGGGPTGVEIAGQLAVLARRGMRGEFTRSDPAMTRVVLLDAGERVLTAFSPKLSAKAARELGSLGVEVREGARATEIDADGVSFEVGGRADRIHARTVIWAAGIQAAGFAKIVSAATGAPRDHGCRLEVGPDLALIGHPEISVIGDASVIAGAPVPGLATAAIQQARHVADGIRSGAPGAVAPFRYFDKGALAVVGRGRAVCEIRGLKISGPPAFLAYLGVHLFYLGGVPGRRVKVLTAWASASFGDEQSRVIERGLPQPRVRV